MKISTLSIPLLLSACATDGIVTATPPNMTVVYRDLSLDTPTGRAELARRVDRAVRHFCAAYDPQADNAIFDVRLASARLCRGAATVMLASKMPTSVRRAYRAGVKGE